MACQKSRKHDTPCKKAFTDHQVIGMSKLSRLTKVRIQCYDLKIGLNDFFQRIVNSVNAATVFQKTTLPHNQRNSMRWAESQLSLCRSRKRYIRSREVILNPVKKEIRESTTRSRMFHSDRETTHAAVLRLPRSKSTERYNPLYKDGYKPACGNKMSCKRSNQKWRKQRSSLTKRKPVNNQEMDSQRSPYSKVSKNSLHTGTGDVKSIPSSSQKSLCSSECTETINSRTAVEKSNKVKKHRHRQTSSSADSKSRLEKNTQTEKTEQPNQESSPTKELDTKSLLQNERQTTKVLSQYQRLKLNKHNGALDDGEMCKSFWERLGKLVRQTRKRKKDIDNLPPKLFKFGFQLTPHGEHGRKSVMDNVIMDWKFPFFKTNTRSSQNAPPDYDVTPPYSYRRNYISSPDSPVSPLPFVLDNVVTGQLLPKRESDLTQPMRQKINEIMQKHSPGLEGPTPDPNSITSHFRAVSKKLKLLEDTPSADPGNGFSCQNQRDKKGLIFPSTCPKNPETNINTSKDCISLPASVNTSSLRTPASSALVKSCLQNFSKNTTEVEKLKTSFECKGVTSIIQNRCTGTAALNRYNPKTEFTAKFSHLLAQN